MPTNFSTGNPFLDLFYILFNGVSEVPLISSPITGILILAGIFLASRKAGFMMTLSSLIGAGMGLILGADYKLITFGLFGFNSVLTGMAFWSGPFVKANKATFWYSIFGAAVTAVFWMAFAHIMGDFFAIGGQGYAIPGFTASFIFTSWFLIFASQRFGYDFGINQKKEAEEYKMHQYNENKVKLEPLQPENPTQEQQQEFKWTVSEFIKSTLKGVSQVTFVENWKTGIFWIVGLTLSFELAPLLTGNPTYWWSNAYSGSFNPLYLAWAMALLASEIGTALSILMKIPTNEVKTGLHGYNQVLVMIALTNFLPLSWQTFLYAILATVMCTYVMYFMQNLFGKWGLPAFIGPFVITAWVFMFAVNGFHALPAGVGWARP